MKRRMVIILVVSLLFGVCYPLNANAYEGKRIESETSVSITNSFADQVCEDNTQSLDYSIVDSEVVIEQSEDNEVALIPKTSVSMVVDNKQIVNEYVCEAEFDYDDMTVTYYSTEGVVLHTQSYKETNPTENSVSVSFTPLDRG